MKAGEKSTLAICSFADELNHESKKVLDSLPASWEPLYIRAISEAINGKNLLLRRIRSATAIEPQLPEGVTVSEMQLQTNAGTMRIRIYTPNEKDPNAGTIFYVHGGGWCLGGVENSSHLCAQMTASLRITVVVPDYRLSPENMYPAANDDLEAAAKWLFENAGTIGINPGKIYFAGDSAGAQLAVCTALRRLDAMQQMPAAMMLFYPVVTLGNNTTIAEKYSKGGLLSAELFEAMKSSYLPAGVQPDIRDISPLCTSLSGLPNTLILPAECDLLSVDAKALAKKLMEDKVCVQSHQIRGVPHAFLTAPGFDEKISEALKVIEEFIRS